MIEALPNIHLASCLAPLAVHLSQSDVTDLFINRPGEVWLETLGGSINRVEVPELQHDALLRLARQIAAATGQGINREHPLLAASLPTGERVQVIIPPATRGEVAIAIRKHVVSDLTLADYQLGSHSPVPGSAGDLDRGMSHAYDDLKEVSASFLGEAVRQRRNILVSGGTSTGKTTLLNVLMREIPQGERLILIEDAPEVKLHNENSVGLIATRGAMGEASVSVEDLLVAALRMRPDRIILGEIRGSEAATFLRAVNTGHPGSLTTIHADSPLRAIDQLALLVLQTGMRMAWDDVVTYIRRSLDVIVQLQRSSGSRTIKAIYHLRE